jgi:hypothetical protein
VGEWPAGKARRVLAALVRIGWVVERETGSHKTLACEEWPDVAFAFVTARSSARVCSHAWPSARGSDRTIRDTSRRPNHEISHVAA